ncbi:hypothetical protein C2G38_332376 [Gigaspora rosea]|uniref:Ion transport domain-containing protein n=1 Tax=Gigaspora rosea TaxID=44941 RepID=A0A397UET2_9GLOM|nr:hypothetical protein C2G38_332376 [Gigaspora rosea]
MKFTTYTYNKSFRIDGVYLIASNIGARLLIMAHNTEANSNIQNQFQYPCIVKSKKIIGFIDGNMNGNIDRKLIIKELIRDEKNWIAFIRKTLEDSNNIYMSSLKGEIIDFIEKIKAEISEPSDKIIETTDDKTTDNDGDNVNFIYNKTFTNYLVKWSVKCNKTNDILTAEFQETMDKINVRPEIYSEAKSFVIECKCLENDDLIMITQDEIMFIWTFSTKKKIQLIYLWKYNEVIDKLKDINYFFFPPPSYEVCVEHISFLQQNNTKRFFLNELVDEHIENEFFLILYGEKLIKVLIDEDQDTLLQKLCNRCVKIIFESDKVLTPNIQLFRIISHSISEIFKVNPTFFADFVIQISFLCIFDQRYLKRFLKNKIPPKHLYHYGYYSSLSKLTYLDSLIEFYFNNSVLNSILEYTKEIISWIKRYKYRMRVGYYYEKQLEKHPRLLLMFPLQHFVTYPKEYNFWKELFKPKPSRFIELSELSFYKTWNDAFYKTWNGEALINYKWNIFGRKYYLAIWAIYTVFLCSFIIVATLSDHMSWNCQKFFLHTTIILGSWHLFFELRQFIYSPIDYFSSTWNYLDLIAIISTMATSINWLKFGYTSTWAITFSTLLLELKFIIFFRSIQFFGIYLAMIMNTVDKVIQIKICLHNLVPQLLHLITL